jgi:hypothetical protein
MDFSNLLTAATSAASTAPFQDVAKLFEAFNMDRLQEAQQAEAEDVQERRDSLPFPQLPSAQSFAAMPPDAFFRGAPAAAAPVLSAASAPRASGGASASAPPAPARTVPSATADAASAARAAEAAFLADLTSAGLDASVTVAADDAPSPMPRAPPALLHAATPGGVGRRSALRPAPGAGTFAVAPVTEPVSGMLESARAGAANLFDDAFKRAAVAAAGVRSTASSAAVGFSTYLSGSVGGGAAPSAAPPALAASGDWLSRAGATAAARQGDVAPPGGVRRGPASIADRAIFAMLGVGGGGGGGTGGATRDGVPIVTLEGGGGVSKGLNPALLASAGGGAVPNCAASCEAAASPVLAPICCALVPISLAVRAGALCCAGVLSCGGLAQGSVACRVLAERATPRAILVALLVAAVAYVAWHWLIQGADGALEWGSAPTGSAGKRSR